MARKRTLRERALDAIGDFAGYANEEMIREKMAAIYERDALESGEAPEPMPEPEKRKRGRPHKHKAAGGQFSVWLPDETKKRLQVLAASKGVSAGELAARFIEAGLLK